jgi:HSP20 family molecular chaperone IbpA
MARENPNQVTRNGSDNGAGTQSLRRSSAPESVLRPPVDIHETADDITLHADMPGVSKERLDIRVEGTNLLIQGEIGIAPQEQMAAMYADVRATAYRRSFVLSNELDTDRIQANLKDGLLTVRIPKRAEVRPRRIEVQS